MELSAILSSFIKLPFIIKTGLLSIFAWPILAVSSYTQMHICIHVGTRQGRSGLPCEFDADLW